MKRKQRQSCVWSIFQTVALSTILFGALWLGYYLSKQYGDHIRVEYHRIVEQVSSYVGLPAPKSARDPISDTE